MNHKTAAEGVPEESKTVITYGDVLEDILARVPLIDLVHASSVSKAWKRAVSSSLRHLNTLKPWLVVHTQSHTSPYLTTTHAYDPRSNFWMKIQKPSIKHVSALRSSHSTLLYELSPFEFSFSFDPLHLRWHHTDRAPLVWRSDPIVALVGRRVIVAGGTCDFLDDPFAVEIYDLESSTWATSEAFPAVFRDYAASTCLSVAVDDKKMYVVKRNSGVMYSFDSGNDTWCGPYKLRPDENIYTCVIGFVNSRLILVGGLGTAETVEGMEVWEVKINGDDMECEKIGKMPRIMMEKMEGENSTRIPLITLTSMGDFLYLHNEYDPGEVIVCEVVHEGLRWGSVRNVVLNDRTRRQRMVFTSSVVDVGVVQKAIRSETGNFAVKVLK